MITLGIDPGTRYAGFSVLRGVGSNKLDLIDYGCLKLNPKDDIPRRLVEIHDFFESKIKEHAVDKIALETPFLGKNVQSFLKLGYVRGIIYFLASKFSLPLDEFSPQQVKKGVTSSGRANKDQVALSVRMLFPGLKGILRDDITDAISIGLCSVWGVKMK